MNERENKTLIFVETKRKADDLTRKMTRVGLEVMLTAFILLAAQLILHSWRLLLGFSFYEYLLLGCSQAILLWNRFVLVIASLAFVPLWLIYSVLPSA